MSESRLKEYIDLVVDNRGKTPPLAQSGTELIEVNAISGNQKTVDYGLVRKFVSEETYQSWFRTGHPHCGDVLITTVGGIGRVAYVGKSCGCIAQNIISLRTKPEKLNGNYLYYYLNSNQTQARLQNLNIGVAQPSLKVPHLLDLYVSFPPLPTQRKIAAILSAYDDLIENNLRRIRILEEMAQNLYREWFVKFRFPGHQKARFTDSPLGRIPEGWEVKVVGQLAYQSRDSVNPGSAAPETPYFGLEHLPRKSITLSEWGIASQVHSTKLSFNKGDILFGKIRPYFHKVGVAPLQGVCSSDILVIRSRSADWFGLVLGCTSSAEFVERATVTSQGTKMPRANWDVLVKYEIPMPPQPILGRFNEFMCDTVSQIHNLVFRNQSLRSTRDLLLPRLISGELDVSEMDIAVPEEAA
jgi:type I restriction enzyme, S subunit